MEKINDDISLIDKYKQHLRDYFIDRNPFGKYSVLFSELCNKTLPDSKIKIKLINSGFSEKEVSNFFEYLSEYRGYID